MRIRISNRLPYANTMRVHISLSLQAHPVTAPSRSWAWARARGIDNGAFRTWRYPARMAKVLTFSRAVLRAACQRLRVPGFGRSLCYQYGAPSHCIRARLGMQIALVLEDGLSPSRSSSFELLKKLLRCQQSLENGWHDSIST